MLNLFYPMIIVNHHHSEIIGDILVMLLIIEMIAEIMLMIIGLIVEIFMLILVCRVSYKFSFYMTRRFILTLLIIMGRFKNELKNSQIRTILTEANTVLNRVCSDLAVSLAKLRFRIKIRN